MAGLLVGSAAGRAGGVAPGATVLPIRVAGWQADQRGDYAVYARTDQLLAGLERAVDPNGDGDAHDAARIALIPLVEPFAAFSDSPLARAVEGAQRLDTLVVAAAGNDGPAGPAFGSVGGPGRRAGCARRRRARRAARQATSVRVVVRAGLSRAARPAGPARRRRAAAAARSCSGRPRRAAPVSLGQSFFDHGVEPGRRAGGRRRGRRRPRRDRALGLAARARAPCSCTAGGSRPGAIGLDERIGVPVVAIPDVDRTCPAQAADARSSRSPRRGRRPAAHARSRRSRPGASRSTAA